MTELTDEELEILADRYIQMVEYPKSDTQRTLAQGILALIQEIQSLRRERDELRESRIMGAGVGNPAPAHEEE